MFIRSDFPVKPTVRYILYRTATKFGEAMAVVDGEEYSPRSYCTPPVFQLVVNAQPIADVKVLKEGVYLTPLVSDLGPAVVDFIIKDPVWGPDWEVVQRAQAYKA